MTYAVKARRSAGENRRMDESYEFVFDFRDNFAFGNAVEWDDPEPLRIDVS